jgi:hypothetical protein
MYEIILYKISIYSMPGSNVIQNPERQDCWLSLAFQAMSRARSLSAGRRPAVMKMMTFQAVILLQPFCNPFCNPYFSEYNIIIEKVAEK